MASGIKYAVGCMVLGELLSATCSAQLERLDLQKRGMTIADAISMTRIAGTSYPYFSPKSGFAVFSPDGKYFAIVVAKGDLKHNATDYSLLLFRSAEIFHCASPKKLTILSSSSNRAGISDVKWLEDNDTILFLGSRGTEPTQLYSIQRGSGELKRLTSHRTPLVSYAVSAKGTTIVYAAETPERGVINDEVLQHGMDVNSERLSDLVRGQISNHEPELFLKRVGSFAERRLLTQDPFDSGVNDLFFSPNKQYVVLKTDVKDLPERWLQYDDQAIQAAFRRGLKKGFSSRILHYELINLRTGRSEILLDAPTTYSSSDVLWSPDSQSLLLCGTYLPLNVENPAELQARRGSKFVVEIRLASREFIKLTNQNLTPIRWDQRTNAVQFNDTSSGQAGGAPGTVYYRKANGQWKRPDSIPEFANDARPQVFADEDLNAAPQIYAMDPQTTRKTLLVSLNPQFAQLALGQEEEIHWTTRGGTLVNGGLYLPPNYMPGKKYPLVIQTHGFDQHGFWVDGPYPSAFAAQPLANRGIVVLQMDDIFYDSLDTPREASRVLEAYESAIDYLDNKGIIDLNRVGLIGFSRTCLYVKYALTHSNRHFAAALVSDGVDAGYFQYLLFYNANPSLASEFETIVGGPPFGTGLSLWLKNSPGFLLDKVRTPLLIQAIGPESILGESQWFEGLKRLEKPVDMVYLPTGTHVLVRPWDRMVSQQGSVDWFDFWLNGHEDPDPAKAEQYVRWRELRKLQEQNEKKSSNAASPTPN